MCQACHLIHLITFSFIELHMENSVETFDRARAAT